MKIAVCLKRVIDYNVKIRVKSDGSGVDTMGVKMSMNPFDEIAVEQAIRMKEKGLATETVAITIGDKPCVETLRAALALGIDRAIHIETTQTHEPLNIAKILKVVVERETPQLVLLGKQAIDDDANQTPQMLAALLDWPQAVFASQLDLQGNTLHVTREVDGGLEVVTVTLPALVSVDLRLNTPRFASLPNIMKAKQKPLETIYAQDLGLNLTPRVHILKTTEPLKRTAGVRVESVDALIAKLQLEAKVIA